MEIIEINVWPLRNLDIQRYNNMCSLLLYWTDSHILLAMIKYALRRMLHIHRFDSHWPIYVPKYFETD